ncbi:MAG TPA: alpha/beta fold hydrolase [Chloroflexota bacterium]|nr:alpha/beta fold hydrolase [Chloroflexota bacterium]HLI51370.1 alpha/beta fold hydrolase [Thermomicrobiaceae bacterium]
MSRLTTMLGLVFGALAGLGAYNTWLSWQAGPLESSLPGTSRFFHWLRDKQVFNVFYKFDGEGTSVVLIHGIDAGASSYEMRRLFEMLRQDHRVYALDLLGFGLSDRPARSYTAKDYIDLIEAFLRQIVEQPAAIVASSLSAAYAVEVAARAPDLVRSLVLICPTGLERLADPPAGWQKVLGIILRLPIVGSAVYNALVSRASLRYFLAERTYADPKRVTNEMIDDYYRTTHQDGARYAPAAFVAGALNQSIRETYPTLTQPVTVVWGRSAKVTPVSDSNLFLHVNPNTKLEILGNAGLLPHDERPEEFAKIVRRALGATTSESA